MSVQVLSLALLSSILGDGTGIEFPFVPETNGVPLVCDMSSNFLSRTFDITKVRSSNNHQFSLHHCIGCHQARQQEFSFRGL